MKAHFDPHSKFRELLAARLDRQLTRAENRVLVAHLRTCPVCRQAERDYIDQRSLLRSMSQPAPPRDMWARTSTALDREVARWSYRYPRFGRPRVPTGDERRGGAPNALATAVAALGVVTVLAVLQLAPATRPAQVVDPVNDSAAPGAPNSPVAVASFRPTPFSVAPQQLSFVVGSGDDLTVYRTDLAQVCPQDAYDCLIEEGITRQTIDFGPRVQPENVAVRPNGSEIAFVGSDAGHQVIAVVMPPSTEGTPEATPDRQTQRPDPTPTVRASRNPEPTPRRTPRLSETPTEPTPAETARVVDPSSEPTPDPDTTPVPADTPTPAPATPVPSLIASPPASAVAGLSVLSILEDVRSAGAPPAWSRDGSTLAFSAMPADGSHGPDVYVWRPGDDRAHAITTDHTSHFASWSGRRIVLSRVIGDAGKSDSLMISTVVIDPQTLEERAVVGPQLWLPIVDDERTHAIAWHGHLDRRNGLPVLRSGVLYLVDWAALNPFRVPDEDPAADPAARDLIPVDPSRDPRTDPVVDWSVRWSTDGRVVGVWEGETPNSPWGNLELISFDRELGQLDEALIDPQLARRGFALGVDRVAWVGSTGEGTDGELRIRTWGTDGVGGLRIRTIDVEEVVPGF